MNKKQVTELIEILKMHYPEAKCSLNFSTPFELAVAVMLSAQCTDERVNKITPILFSRFSTPKDFIDAPLSEIENLIKPCGFYKVKAQNIKNMSIMIEKEFNGVLPNNMDDLMKLPGIGRKSANVIMVDAYNNPQGIAVDTHVKRISKKIGLSNEETPEKIEQDLLKIIPKKYLSAVNHLFIYHGRAICKAKSPDCTHCPVAKYCIANRKNLI